MINVYERIEKMNDQLWARLEDEIKLNKQFTLFIESNPIVNEEWKSFASTHILKDIPLTLSGSALVEWNAAREGEGK